MSINCHCGSNKTYQTCCKPYHDLTKNIPTPEALLRTRFSAYVLKLTSFIQSTMLPPALLQFDENVIKTGFTKYIKLTILDQQIISPDKEATITFEVSYQEHPHDSITQKFLETSIFKKVNKKWFYIDGVVNS